MQSFSIFFNTCIELVILWLAHAGISRPQQIASNFVWWICALGKMKMDDLSLLKKIRFLGQVFTPLGLFCILSCSGSRGSSIDSWGEYVRNMHNPVCYTSCSSNWALMIMWSTENRDHGTHDCQLSRWSSIHVTSRIGTPNISQNI